MASFNLYSTRGMTYDVFLSFRGDDTRYNFVDHLYTALIQRGIRAFKDDETLHRGKPISSDLLKAIEESRYAVVVLSENYANSSWCLEELAKIMECHDQMGQKVLPVFYYIDPSHFRGHKRKWATTFQNHEDKWNKALTATANISGFLISKTQREGESAVITKIVQEILGGIQTLSVDKNLIGIDSRIDDLNKLLDMEATEEVRMVGICGMGGIGKTTIAQALFRRISYKFESSSFVKDVGENSNRDICDLQQKILKDILATPHEPMIQDPADGAEMIRIRFCNKKVLLVLDDVDNVKQLEFLAAKHEWFGPGSRIIITTRDEHLLSDANAKYKPELLLMDQAVELFSRHAFHKYSPPKGYGKLTNRAVCYTGCLPLALKVLGSYFHGRHVGVWEDALNKLAETPNDEIYQTLKLSFDGLEVSEKKIFLDIACFFKGAILENVTRVLDSCGFHPMIGIHVLIEKSLITVSKQRLDMHDLIQEMGWKIVHESFPNSRLWKLEEIHDFIMKNKKLKAIEAIVAHNDKYVDNMYCETMGFNADVFERMKNLRLLDVEEKFTSSKPTVLPDELRWLCWANYPFSSLPVANTNRLVGLKMHCGNIEHLWRGQKIMQNLKFIHLTQLMCLTRFPDVSGAPNIERLVLSDCYELVEVDESLGLLKRLVYLDMSYCKKLKYLPPKIEMESLETLILSECCSLERFPEFSPCMVKLSHINLASCSKIEELPSSIRCLSNLSILNLESCTSLKNIPNSIYELKYLKSLRLHDCRKLQKLPDEFGSMENLQELYLGSVDILYPFIGQAESINFLALTNLCSLRKLDLSWRQIGEEEFPKNLHGFSSLEELHLSGNYELTQLPASISHLSNLKHLDLNHCCRLKYLHGLPSGIQVLNASNCISLEMIEDLSKEYDCLYKIWLFGCKKLREDEECERHLDKMLTQSFLKKCAAVNHQLSIAIPGSKIPSWFKEQKHGHEISLKLPPKWKTRIMGFALCGVFKRMIKLAYLDIDFRFENDGSIFSKQEVDYFDASATANNEDMWIGYIPLTLFEQTRHDGDDFQSEDWSHISEGTLVIDVSLIGQKMLSSVRCGARVVYKEDVESILQLKPSISSSYWNWNLFDTSENTLSFYDCLY